jgi:membrane protein DedA with SNARE-associated domain
MSLEQIVATFGYPAVLLGTFLEGETILIIGGFLAQHGYLELPWVVVCAFTGTLAGDQLFVYLGRWKGMAAAAARPRWRARIDRLSRILRRHQNWVILGFRFLYGVRTVTPFVLGASGIAPLRFLVLNILGAAIWAVAFGAIGYAIGQTLGLVLADVKRYELLAAAVVLAAGVLVYLVVRTRRTLALTGVKRGRREP